MGDTESSDGKESVEQNADDLTRKVSPLDAEGKEEVRRQVREQLQQERQQDSQEPEAGDD